jgi:hypothetical protein
MCYNLARKEGFARGQGPGVYTDRVRADFSKLRPPSSALSRSESAGEWEIRVYIDTSTEAAGLVYDYKFPNNRAKKFRGVSADEQKLLLENVIQLG